MALIYRRMRKADLDAVVGGVQEDAVLDGKVAFRVFTVEAVVVKGGEGGVSLGWRFKPHTCFDAFWLTFNRVVTVGFALVKNESIDDDLRIGTLIIEVQNTLALGAVHFVGWLE